MIQTIAIDGKGIGGNYPPYIIAELSANHNGSLERAKHSIMAAKESGASAVKIQSYTPDTMTIDCDADDFKLKTGLWKGYKLYDLYREAYTPYEWHKELFVFARQIGITIFSTPFDETAVDLLASLNVPAYKIASFELVDLPLIEYVAKKQKPMIMSTGMSSEEDIAEALEVVRMCGCKSIVLLHCISSYPAPIEQANLRQIQNLRRVFNINVGLSDHTIGNTASIVAVTMGAPIIEKHFTLSRSDTGPDSSFSIEPFELKSLVKDANDAWLSLGKEGFERPASENENLIFKRSIYFIKSIKAGEKITFDNIARIRPGYGLPPKFYYELIGRTVIRDVSRGEPLSWDLIK